MRDVPFLHQLLQRRQRIVFAGEIAAEAFGAFEQIVLRLRPQPLGRMDCKVQRGFALFRQIALALNGIRNRCVARRTG